MGTRKELTSSKLIELHVRQNLSLSKIGEMYGISRQRVHQLKKEYEKSAGKINRRLFIDVITLKHFLEKGWTAKEIAKHYEMKPSKISRLIRKYKEEYEMGASNIKINRKTAKDLISKSVLYDLYIHKLFTDEQIAKEFHVSPSTINLLRKEYGIPTNNDKSLRKLPMELTDERFKQLYANEGYTLQEIADKYQCNIMAIIRLKEKYQITK